MTTPPSQPGKQQRKSLEARRKICEATVRCLAQQGYHRTSIARVVETAGVTPGALQHHFPTKEDLIVATADMMLEGSIERARRFAASHGDPDLALPEFLRAMWKNLLNTDPYRALLQILLAARTERRLHDRITPTLHRWNRAFDEAFVEIFESVGRDSEDVETIMLMTRSLMRGLVLQEGYGDEPEAKERAIERWIGIVAPMLRMRPAKS